MEKKKVLQIGILFLSLGLLLAVVQIFHFGSLTGFIVLEQSNESSFTGGTYNNTFYQDGSISLFAENLTGDYVSEIFDAGRLAKWNNVSWEAVGDLVVTLRSCDDEVCLDDSWNEIHFNPPADLIVSDNQYFQYKIDFARNDSEQNVSFANLSIDYELLEIPPTLEIISPQNGATYHNNESINLNFSVSDSNLDSCWYNLADSANISIENCEELYFETSEGEHTLNLYSNNTLGFESFVEVNFSVNNSLPSIVLDFPLSDYVSGNELINFSYIPSGEDLESCSLYGDFNGTWEINQTEMSPINESLNYFSLNLSEDSYSWNVYCNDSAGNLIGAANQSFIVDLSSPVVELSEPTGTKESKSDIPLTFSVEDTSPVKCEFDVSLVDSGTTFSFDLDECQNVEFNVAIEADYETSLKVEDSAGNTEYRSSEFEVDPETAEANEPEEETEENDEEPIAIVGEASLSLTELDDLIIKRGESEFLSLEVLNDGDKFLNSCKLYGMGFLENWVSSSQVEDLSSGQKIEYIFNLNVPLDVDSGKHSAEIIIDCEEISKKTNLDIEIEGLDFEVLILSSKRIGNKLSVTYSVEDFSGVGQEISIIYSLVNSEGIVTYTGNETINLEDGTNFVLEFDLPKDSIGEFELIFEVSNGLESVTEKMSLVLSDKGLSGFAISGDNLKTLSWFGGFIFILFAFYFIFKFLRKHKKGMYSSEKRKFIDLDFDE